MKEGEAHEFLLTFLSSMTHETTSDERKYLEYSFNFRFENLLDCLHSEFFFFSCALFLRLAFQLLLLFGLSDEGLVDFLKSLEENVRDSLEVNLRDRAKNLRSFVDDFKSLKLLIFVDDLLVAAATFIGFSLQCRQILIEMFLEYLNEMFFLST